MNSAVAWAAGVFLACVVGAMWLHVAYSTPKDRPCPFCGGSGHFSNSTDACPVCDGKGAVDR
jgi:hypothetical protein